MQILHFYRKRFLQAKSGTDGKWQHRGRPWALTGGIDILYKLVQHYFSRKA